MTGPAANEVHDLPLANRIVDDLIREYITTACGIARATTSDANAQQVIDQMQHLHLDGWTYRLTPQILDALRRAGLLAPEMRRD